MLPGLSLIDLFWQRLSPQLGQEPVLLLALAPGHLADSALVTLRSAVAFTKELGRVASAEALLHAVAEDLGVEDSASTVAELVSTTVDRLTWPRLLVAEIGADAAGILHCARALANATRDLDGPLRFVLLLPAPVPWPPGEAPQVWEPYHAAPHPLPFQLARPLRGAGFDTYIGCRLYWEAAGRPDTLAAFQELGVQARAWIVAADADARMDRALDRHWSQRLLPQPPWEILVEACGRTQAHAVLRTGILPPARIPLSRLEAAGLCWRPPGSLHPLLTAQAAYHLAQTVPDLNSAERLAPLRAARQNHLLGAWLLGLTGHIERELVRRCGGCTEERLRALGLLERLRSEQTRTPDHLAYSPSTDLLDYASFGELVQLVHGLGVPVPVSRQRLEEARHTRNLAAHLRPATWRAAAGVLELLELLS